MIKPIYSAVLPNNRAVKITINPIIEPGGEIIEDHDIYRHERRLKLNPTDKVLARLPNSIHPLLMIPKWGAYANIEGVEFVNLARLTGG